MQNVIQLPVLMRNKPHSIDWNRIEEVRQQRYPQIPFEALELIRHIRDIELGSRKRDFWSLELNFEPGFYPPENIESSLNQADIIWLLDLLDRLGGEIICGEKTCAIFRIQPRLPMFWINVLDPQSFQAMDYYSEIKYEHYFEVKNHCRIYGKNLPDSHLVMILIWFLDDEGRKYFGFIDAMTFPILLDRIQGGTPLEKVFLLH
jgi:hypothetical protein